MPRLKPELLGRVEAFADRVLIVADQLVKQRVSARVVDQVVGCGTSVGANLCEADEVLSRADFAKSLGIGVKEVNETMYLVRLIARRDWIASTRLVPLEAECVELKKVLGSMVMRTRRGTAKPSSSSRERLP